MEPELRTTLPQKKAYPTIAQGFGIFGVALLVQMAMFYAFSFLYNEHKSLGMLVIYTSFMALTILFAWKMSNRVSLPFGEVPLNILPWIVLLIPALAFLMEPIILALPGAEAFQEMMLSMIGDNMIFAFITVAIAASLLEEVLFRGIILDGFLRNYSPWKAIIWSAFLFGLVHMNPYQFIAAFSIGIIMGWIYWKTGSLWLCILVHFLNNSFGFILSWILGVPLKSAMKTSEMVGGENRYMFLLGCASIAVILSLIMLFINLNKREPRINREV